MKIVRHVARDMRQAMRAIRERLGEDAVILSSRRVSEGVELTAAIDFDAQALEAAKAEHLAVESPSSRDTASARRATPPLRDNDEPVRSKVPLSFDEALREEARLNRTDVPVFRNEARAEDDGVVVSLRGDAHAARADAATQRLVRNAPLPKRSEPHRLDSDSPLISNELQAALLDSLVVRTEEAPHAATTGAASTAPSALKAAPPSTARVPAVHAATAQRPAAAPTAVARLEHEVVDITQPLDLDLTEIADASPVIPSPAAQRPALVSDVVGTELKSLRRMLETQLAQLAWNDMTRRAPIHAEVLRELSEIGIAQDLATQITQQLPQDADLTYAHRFSIAALSQYLLVTGDRWLDNGGRIAFIGSTGVGKTMTLSKLAVRWVLRHGPRDLALVGADNIRLGAQDQMRSLGQLLGAPVYTPENFETLPTLLSRLQQRLILIDTPGSSLRDTQLSSRLAVLASSASQLQTALVLAASTQAGALEEVVKRFVPANPACCVLTKIDEAASLGGALSVLIRARVPVSYVSEGQRVPEDLRPARALELVSNAVRLAKASGASADEDLLRRRFGKIAHAIT
jgi:flagellar biosynthesis protein FlhF